MPTPSISRLPKSRPTSWWIASNWSLAGSSAKGDDDRETEHGEQREGEAEEDGDAADARFRLIVHPPLVAVVVDDAEVNREPQDERRR